MNLGKEKLKEFVQEKTDELAGRLEHTPQQKLFVFFLVVISISAVVLGYLQFKKTLDEPFVSEYIKIKRAELEDRYGAGTSQGTAASQQEKNIQLQNKDSDLDGLSDYSEIYLYQTNAYLADTDFDGSSDKDEVIAGTDPTCAAGTVCAGANAEYTAPVPSQTSGTSAGIGNINIGTADPAQLQALQQQVFSGEVDLNQLGIDNPELQAFLELYQSYNQQTATTLSDEEKQSIRNELGSLSADELRQQLIAQGIDPQLLLQIDDQTLLDTFSQTLQGL